MANELSADEHLRREVLLIKRPVLPRRGEYAPVKFGPSHASMLVARVRLGLGALLLLRGDTARTSDESGRATGQQLREDAMKSLKAEVVRL